MSWPWYGHHSWFLPLLFPTVGIIFCHSFVMAILFLPFFPFHSLPSNSLRCNGRCHCMVPKIMRNVQMCTTASGRTYPGQIDCLVSSCSCQHLGSSCAILPGSLVLHGHLRSCWGGYLLQLGPEAYYQDKTQIIIDLPAQWICSGGMVRTCCAARKPVMVFADQTSLEKVSSCLGLNWI